MVGVQWPLVMSAVSELGNPERGDRRTVGRAPVKSLKIVALQQTPSRHCLSSEQSAEDARSYCRFNVSCMMQLIISRLELRAAATVCLPACLRDHDLSVRSASWCTTSGAYMLTAGPLRLSNWPPECLFPEAFWVLTAKEALKGAMPAGAGTNLSWEIASSCLLTTIDDLKLQLVIMHQHRHAVSLERVNAMRFLRNVPAVQAMTLRANRTLADDQ